MRFALVEKMRSEAKPKLRGACLNCGREVVAKCGDIRIWHWAHLGKLECDHWWEPETEWHRLWKGKFPQKWQEVVHVSESGERHIADIKTPSGLVVELQHSPISSEERISRETFYRAMVWVVDGRRYKRDLTAFSNALALGSIVNDSPMYLRPRTDTAAIFRRWSPLQCIVFIDFGDEAFTVEGLLLPTAVLWVFQLDRMTGKVVIGAVTRDSFVQYCLDGSALQWLEVTRFQQPATRYLFSRNRRHQMRRRF